MLVSGPGSPVLPAPKRDQRPGLGFPAAAAGTSAGLAGDGVETTGALGSWTMACLAAGGDATAGGGVAGLAAGGGEATAGGGAAAAAGAAGPAGAAGLAGGEAAGACLPVGAASLAGIATAGVAATDAAADESACGPSAALSSNSPECSAIGSGLPAASLPVLLNPR